ncbi:Putative ribonuclease H protein [Arachis hypogaea]|nr:Putative ribonuclease H protein [Arachis hypogaea]
MWCRENGNYGIPMVKWEIVQAPKKVGGLGVGDAVLRNTALLFKWWWRFSKEDCPLWKKIVCSCNKLNPDVMLATQPLPVKGGPWKDICQLNIKEPRIRDKVVSGLVMEVGNGMQTRFWEDNWVQGGTLKGSHPRLYSISSQQGLVIGECGFWDGLDWIWNFQWRRALFQWELELVNQLHERLRPVRLSSGREDNVVWKFENKGIFSTSSVIQAIQAETLSAEITSYSFTSSIWKGFVPPRIELFGWFVLVGRVNTKERLTKLGVNILGDSMCVLCTKELESVEHLFLRCEVTWQVWCKWLRLLGREWVIPGTVKEMFESWHGMHNRQQGKKMWMSVFFAVIWNIWLERNARIFKNARASLEVIHTRTLMSYTEWSGGDPGGG